MIWYKEKEMRDEFYSQPEKYVKPYHNLIKLDENMWNNLLIRRNDNNLLTKK